MDTWEEEISDAEFAAEHTYKHLPESERQQAKDAYIRGWMRAAVEEDQFLKV